MHHDTRHQVLHDNWPWLKDSVQHRWDLLDDGSLEQIDGDDERLLDRIQVAYGIHRDIAEEQLEHFMDDYHDYFELVRDRSPATPISPRPHT